MPGAVEIESARTYIRVRMHCRDRSRQVSAGCARARPRVPKRARRIMRFVRMISCGPRIARITRSRTFPRIVRDRAGFRKKSSATRRTSEFRRRRSFESVVHAVYTIKLYKIIIFFSFFFFVETYIHSNSILCSYIPKSKPSRLPKN